MSCASHSALILWLGVVAGPHDLHPSSRPPRLVQGPTVLELVEKLNAVGHPAAFPLISVLPPEVLHRFIVTTIVGISFSPPP